MDNATTTTTTITTRDEWWEEEALSSPLVSVPLDTLLYNSPADLVVSIPPPSTDPLISSLPRIPEYSFEPGGFNPYNPHSTDPEESILYKRWRLDELKHLKEQQDAELKEAKAKVLQWERDNKILFFGNPEKQYLGKYGKWGPNPGQEEFFSKFRQSLETIKLWTFTGGNRCLAPWQKIYDPVQKKNLVVSKIKKPFNVYAYDHNDKKIIIDKAEKPFKKPNKSKIYKVCVSRRQTIFCAQEHQLMTLDGEYKPISQLQVGDVLFPHQTNLEFYPSSFLSDVLRLKKTVLNFLSHCYYGRCRCGEQSPKKSNIFLNVFLKLDDVRKHIFSSAFLQKDDTDSILKHIRFCLSAALLSSLGVFHHFSVLFFLILHYGMLLLFPFYEDLLYNIQRLLSESYLSLRINVLNLPFCKMHNYEAQDPSLSEKLNQTFLIKYKMLHEIYLVFHRLSLLYIDFLLTTLQSVVSLFGYILTFYSPFIKDSHVPIITKIKQFTREEIEVYDFDVPKCGNYFIGQGLNHNSSKSFTFTGIVSLMFTIGRFPWEDPKVVGTWIWDRLGWKPPIRIRIVGQDWLEHLKQVVVPTMEEIYPKIIEFDKKKNNQGIDASWTHKENKSTIELMSNNSEAAVFEGASLHVVIYDEPPNRQNRIASSRGLMDFGGIEFFAMTLLKEAWVDKEVINLVTEDGSPDPSVYNINVETYNNLGFGVSQEGITQYMKALTEDEIQARIKGIPSYKAGLCLKFKRQTHIVDMNLLEVPSNWMVDVAIDIGLAKPHDITFLATNERNFKYLIHAEEVRGNGTIIADRILKFINTYKLRLNRVIVDPLAKADKNNENSTYEQIDQQLSRFGYYLETGTKDKEDGIRRINEYLETIHGYPAFFILRSSSAKAIRQIENWMIDADTGKPSKEDDDNCENLYRLFLLDTKYEEMEDPDDYPAQKPVSSSTRNPVTGY